MNCHEFDFKWNTLLDADFGQDETPAEITALEHELGVHAASCASCRAVHGRYQRLQQAIGRWTTRPVTTGPPPHEAVDRILAESGMVAGGTGVGNRPRFLERAERRSSGSPRIVLIALAAAAALLLPLLSVLIRFDREKPVARVNPQLIDTRTSPRIGEGRALANALADATEASWDLARTASEPAARLGRDVLDAATTPSTDRSDVSLTTFSSGRLAAELTGGPDVSPAVTLIQQVGDRLAAGVRPLSSTARQAFGFLRTPPLEKLDRRVLTPSAKGA